MNAKIRHTLFLVILLGCGCSYVPERIEVAYHPTKGVEQIFHASAIPVSVQVVDHRKKGSAVGYKKNGDGEERAAVQLSNGLAKEISEAVALELARRGFSIQPGGLLVQIEVQKLYNEFKPGLFGSRGVSEIILSATVGDSQGEILYSKTIIGMGEKTHILVQSGNNVRRSLEEALGDALDKMLNDRAFLQALYRT